MGRAIPRLPRDPPLSETLACTPIDEATGACAHITRDIIAQNAKGMTTCTRTRARRMSRTQETSSMSTTPKARRQTPSQRPISPVKAQAHAAMAAVRPIRAYVVFAPSASRALSRLMCSRASP